MNTIPTVEEFMTDHYQIKHYGKILLKPSQAAIEFAKLHVQAQQEAISESVLIKYDKDNDAYINKDAILNAYPLENIK